MHVPMYISNPVSLGFDSSLTKRIDHTAESDIASGRITCADILVARHGMVAYYKQHGCSNVEEKTPLLPNAVFRLASMTKPVVAVAVLIQQERGALSVEDPVARYIPEFADVRAGVYGADGDLTGTVAPERPILIRDLLTHSSGLCSGEYFNRISDKYSPHPGETLADVVPRYPGAPLEFQPGTATSYSPIAAFDTLARLVEITSGLPIQAFMEKNVFGPLGMDSTGFVATPELTGRTVRMYAQTDRGPEYVDTLDQVFMGIAPTCHSGGGGLLGTAPDYYRLAQMLLNGGAYGGVRLLKEETVCAMAAEQVSHTLRGVDEGWTWGFGVRTVLRDNGSQRPLPTGAFGWSGAFGTHFWMDPKNDLTVVYMSNMSTAGGSGAVTAREIERDVYASLKD